MIKQGLPKSYGDLPSVSASSDSAWTHPRTVSGRSYGFSVIHHGDVEYTTPYIKPQMIPLATHLNGDVGRVVIFALMNVGDYHPRRKAHLPKKVSRSTLCSWASRIHKEIDYSICTNCIAGAGCVLPVQIVIAHSLCSFNYLRCYLHRSSWLHPQRRYSNREGQRRADSPQKIAEEMACMLYAWDNFGRGNKVFDFQPLTIFILTPRQVLQSHAAMIQNGGNHVLSSRFQLVSLDAACNW